VPDAVTCVAVADPMHPEALACAPPPPPKCNDTWQTFTASMVLLSPKHHAGPTQHVYTPVIGADVVENCADQDCAGLFRHGRSSQVKWQARCVLVGDECVARIKAVDPFLVFATNVAGTARHFHGIVRRYGCAFIDVGQGVQLTDNCVINGSEKVKAVADMTPKGDGVVYGSGYAANHDNSTNPAITIGVGYGPVGAGVTISSSASATYTKAIAFAQGMGCDANGAPVNLPNDGDGHDYPWSSEVEGNE
jgi:hypothetical protein